MKGGGGLLAKQQDTGIMMMSAIRDDGCRLVINLVDIPIILFALLMM